MKIGEKYGVVVEVDNAHGYVGLYNKHDGQWSIEMDDEEEVDIWERTPNVGMLVEGSTVGVLDLIADGWTLDGKGLDLRPYTERLKALREVQKILCD